MTTEIAWAAGLFDGEGTFYIAKDRHKYYARMKLGMCHRGAVEKFAGIMGVGNVTVEERPATNSNFKQFRWSISGQKVINCAVRLHPFLVVKQHECDILLRWEPLIANGRNKFITPENLAQREQLYTEMLAARSTHLVRIQND